MFTTLRTRLLTSYTFILVFTLAVTGIALLIVLRTRDAPTDTISQRLALGIQTFWNRPELANIPADGPTRRQERTLNIWIRTARLRGLPIRLILTNDKRVVTYDSTGIYKKGETIALSGELYTHFTASPDEIQFGPSSTMMRGSFSNPDGSGWQFVSGQLDTPNPNDPQLILAVPAPPQLSFGEIVQLYGEDILIPILQAGLIGLILAFAIALLIARSVARPLQEIAQAADAVAKGHLDTRAPVQGPQEARKVAAAFNQMAEEVSATQLAQRDFLANVTHDLRTPLTSIQGFSQAIIDGVASNPEAAQRAARIIHEEAGRLNRMVQELLDMARIEAGRFNMTRHTVHLNELLSGLGERLAPKAQEKGLTFTSELMPLPPIAGDGDRLVQVFTNLVDNAIKHTPEGGRIALCAALYDTGVRVQVADTGEGIPTEDLPRIFDRFYQVDKSRQRGGRDGAGLGLAITKQIVEAHGGKIWAESAEAEGTTISVWLPAPTHDMTTVIRRRSGVFKRHTPPPQQHTAPLEH